MNIEEIELEIDNFIIWYEHEESERKKMKHALTQYIKEDLLERL